MTLDKDQTLGVPETQVGVRAEGGVANDLYDRDTGRSNFVAFLLGGVVISGGLLAFLYLDNDNLGHRDMATTGGLGRIEAPAPTTAKPDILAPSVNR